MEGHFMNREQRRKKEKKTMGRARRAALALLIAGGLVATSIAGGTEALAAVAGDLSINGGGGGGHHSSGGWGAGGGGYVKYAESNGTWIDFGGGGDGYYYPSEQYGVGGIGGGGLAIFEFSLTGGSSGAYLGGAGESGGGDPDFPMTAGTTMPTSDVSQDVVGAATYHKDYDEGKFPESWTVMTTRGDDYGVGAINSDGNGNGGEASVSVTENVSLNNLTVTGGSAGEGPIGILGNGGDASFTATGTLDARSITLDQPAVVDSGEVSFHVNTLNAAKGYSFKVPAAIPTISISAYSFDLTGTNHGDTLLSVTGVTLPVADTTPVTLTSSSALAGLSPGDTVTLIDGVSGTFSPKYITANAPDGVFTFEVSISGSTLIAKLIGDVSLTVAAPVFAAQIVGYTRPAAQSIIITNSSNFNATISTVTVSGTAFEIGGIGGTVPANSSISTWTIQPKAGLGVGNYSETITVTYDNGQTATDLVYFTVLGRTVDPIPSPTIPIVTSASVPQTGGNEAYALIPLLLFAAATLLILRRKRKA